MGWGGCESDVGGGREGDCRTYDNDFLRYCSKYSKLT